MSHFGDRIKAEREEQGLSQNYVAKTAAVSRTHVWMMEQGTSANPTIETIYGISLALGIPAIKLAKLALDDAAARECP